MAFVNVVRLTQSMSMHRLSKALLPNMVHLVTAAKGDIGHGPHNRNLSSMAEAAVEEILVGKLTSLLL